VRRVVKITGMILMALLVAAMTAWASLAIYYSGLPHHGLRAALAGLFPHATVTALCILPRRSRTLFGFFAVLG
jgi:hypothetical protein